MIVSLILALAISAVCIKKYGLPFKRSMIITFSMGILAFIGARILYNLLYLDEFLKDPIRIFSLSFSGYTLYGGLGAGLIGGWFILLKDSRYYLKILDALSPAAGIAAGVSRVGCFLNGCCFGKPTKMPWGISFPRGSLADRAYLAQNPLAIIKAPVPLHPTQLYEMAAALIAAAAAAIVLKKSKKPGTAFCVFGIILTLGRFIIFFYRSFPSASYISNIIRGPVVYGISIIVFTAIWL
jgi:phosphatidylglycerol:prolipoprotein diacylglycerol transferase